MSTGMETSRGVPMPQFVDRRVRAGRLRAGDEIFLSSGRIVTVTRVWLLTDAEAVVEIAGGWYMRVGSDEPVRVAALMPR
jgi:hypothetical protein